MLTDKSLTMAEALRKVRGEKGVFGLFAGVSPRVAMIFLGGGIFFGAYEKTRQLLQ